jgi:polysaccharide pyruvyl transferase WcaK-like protein
MGVSALTAGAIEAALNDYPEGRIGLLDYGKKLITYTFHSRVGAIPVKLTNMRFSRQFYLANNIAVLVLRSLMTNCIPSERLRAKVALKEPCWASIRNADLVGSIAGGDSFSDTYGLRRFLYVFLPQLLVLLLGKKLVLLPQTVGPFNGWLARTASRYVLKRAALIYSRDYRGLEEMRGLLGSISDSDKLRFCYDVGFVVEPHRPSNMDLNGFVKQNTTSPVIGLNVSGLLYAGGYTQNNQFGLKADYRSLVDRLISHLVNEKQATVLLVPHVFGEGEYSESDSAVCEKLYRKLKPKYGDKLHGVSGRYDQSEIKYIIGLCDFFVGSRMHACIAAISQSIPAVPIAYSKKFIGVMETVGMEPYVADPRTMGVEEILAVVDKAWGEREAIKTHLEQKMPEVRERVLSLFREITDTLELHQQNRQEA